MKKKVLIVLSYILVAVLAGGATFGIMTMLMPRDSYTKLEELSDLIQDKFIGDADVTAMSRSPEVMDGTFRISLCRNTTEADLDTLAEVIETEILPRVR